MRVHDHFDDFKTLSTPIKNSEFIIENQVFEQFFSLDNTQYTYNKINTNNIITCDQKFYKARPFDTLIKVAKKFNLKLDTIREMNPKVKFVRPGMSLTVCR